MAENNILGLLLNVGFIGVVFLLVGIVIILSFTAELRPYEKITLGNVELLKSKIEQACSRNSVEFNSFNLPQQELTFVFQASNFINKNIDPRYVVYHENFPIGQGISWETYLHENLNGNVYLAIMDMGNTVDYDDAIAFRNNMKSQLGTKNLIIPNIELTDDLEISTLEKKSKDLLKNSDGTLSENGDYTFNFIPGSNHLKGLSQKYFSCGKNSLCIKTSSGIFKSELSCDATLIYGKTNFYVASPCKSNEIKISKDNGCGSCQNWRTFPIYTYNSKDDIFETNKESHFCADEIKHLDNAIDGDITEPPDKCVKIELVREDSEGGCYSNPNGPFIENIVKGSTKEKITDEGNLYYELSTVSTSGFWREAQETFLPGGTSFWPYTARRTFE